MNELWTIKRCFCSGNEQSISNTSTVYVTRNKSLHVLYIFLVGCKWKIAGDDGIIGVIKRYSDNTKGNLSLGACHVFQLSTFSIIYFNVFSIINIFKVMRISVIMGISRIFHCHKKLLYLCVYDVYFIRNQNGHRITKNVSQSKNIPC